VATAPTKKDQDRQGQAHPSQVTFPKQSPAQTPNNPQNPDYALKAGVLVGSVEIGASTVKTDAFDGRRRINRCRLGTKSRIRILGVKGTIGKALVGWRLKKGNQHGFKGTACRGL
jgi:hypothetical protein